MGIRTLVRGATALAVVVATLLLAAPDRSAGLSDTGCTSSHVGDACSGTPFPLEATSVTLTLTANNVYPACSGGQRNGCLYQYFIRPLASGYNSPAAGSGTCNGTAVGSVAYLPASGPLTCTITYSWTSQDGSAYPRNLTVQVLELDGDALNSGPQNAHGFTTTRDVPAPVAAFTYTRGAGPREFVFTSHATSRLGGLYHHWDFGDGTYGQGVSVTHTFPRAGTFDVELEVSDVGPYDDATTQPVDTEAVAIRTLLALHLSNDPASDPGTFDLAIDGQPRLGSGRPGQEIVVEVPPGVHGVSEVATGVAQTFYDTRLTCRTTAGGALLDVRAVRGSVTVDQGTRVDCTFANVRTTDKHCVVPDLAGLSLVKATKQLRKAHCTLGKVKRHGKGKLVVSKMSPVAGSVRAAKAPVKLTLR